MLESAILSPEQRPQANTPLFRRVVARAVGNAVNVSVAGAAAVGAAVLHSWPLLSLGAVAYAALVAWDLASPDFWRKAIPQDTYGRPEQARLPEPKKVSDPALRRIVESVLAARADLDRQLHDASGDVATQFATLGLSVEELEGRTASLVKIGDQLVHYLAGKDVQALEREVERLRARAAAAKDAEARQQYEQTAKTREEELGVLRDLTGAAERVYANLTRIVATLEGLSAKVVRMRTMDSQAMDNLSGDMNAELERMNREIDTFEETLRGLVATEVAQS